MSNAPDQVRKRAIKRLMQDLEELRNSPVENVSAIPLESNMFEWHCNFNFDNVPYHLILFFPENYPYDSPSAEFVPNGFRFAGGATKKGRKGVGVCLSIFSDFADVHTEWANEKGMGWSPGYTVQAVLLNLVSFVTEMNQNSYASSNWETNRNLATKFKCMDCGHNAKKPFPELPKCVSQQQTDPAESTRCKTAVVDYISKQQYNPSKRPKDKLDLFGYGLVVCGSKYRPSLTTPCELLTGESYYGMKASMGKVHSMLKDELSVFLPLYLDENHGSQIKAEFEAAMQQLKSIIPNSRKASISEMVLRTIPNLMNTTVVEFSKGTQHTSDNHLNGYFALHRLFLWAIETYPELRKHIDERLQEFIAKEDKRNKKSCPNIGEWVMLLSASAQYTWKDAAEAYLSENQRRNVMWYVKENVKLGYLDTDMKYRLDMTYNATVVSRKLLAFQVLFLDIAMPSKWTREQIIARYNETMGFPTPEMVLEMKEAVAKIDSMKTYDDYYQVLKLSTPTNDEIFDKLVKAVGYCINTEGYKFSSGRNQGGWVEVLKRYPRGVDVTKSESHSEKPIRSGVPQSHASRHGYDSPEKKFKSDFDTSSGNRESSSSRYQGGYSGYQERDCCPGSRNNWEGGGYHCGGSGNYRGGNGYHGGNQGYKRGSRYQGDRGYQGTRGGCQGRGGYQGYNGYQGSGSGWHSWRN